MKEIAEVDPEELTRILEIEKEKALEIGQRASEMVEEEGKEPTEVAPKADLGLDPVDQVEGVGEKTAETLRANGFKTVQDLLKADIEKLSSLPGIGSKKAERLLRSARETLREAKK